jgi:thiaminase
MDNKFRVEKDRGAFRCSRRDKPEEVVLFQHQKDAIQYMLDMHQKMYASVGITEKELGKTPVPKICNSIKMMKE